MATRQISKNGENGFSMVEVVVAMAILAIGMLAAFTMQFNSVRNNTTGNIITQANMLAKAQLEFLKGQDLSSLAAGSYSDGALLDETGQPGGIYDRSWTITDLGTSARRITVTVQWQRRGKSGNVFFSSNTRGNGV
jgi:prepilin-type N-terminal cleavage/methylation domain-containing protein